MGSLMLLLASLYECNGDTMVNSVGEKCHEVVEISDPRPRILPSKWGAIPMGIECTQGKLNATSGKCESRYLEVSQ